jgi:hypothetical protein
MFGYVATVSLLDTRWDVSRCRVGWVQCSENSWLWAPETVRYLRCESNELGDTRL